MTRRAKLAPLAAAVGLCLMGWACGRGDRTAAQPAHSTLFNARGGEVAQAQLSETEAGVKIHMNVASLPPGNYTVQIHETGACDPPGFLSAGRPYPPPEDLAMVESVIPPLHRAVAQFQVTDGQAQVDAVAPVVTLRRGDNSLFHPGGTALIIDDLSPAGTYEGRVACGLITRATAEDVELPPGSLDSAQQPENLGTPGKKYQRPTTKP